MVQDAGEPSNKGVPGNGAGRDPGSPDLTTLVRRWLAVPRTSRENFGPPKRDPSPQVAAPAAPEEVLPDQVPSERSPEEAPPAPLAPRLPRTTRPDENGWLTQIPRLAVLIDAGATPPDVAPGLFEVLADTGAVNLRRAYGDWTGQDLGDWLPRLRDLGIQPVHHFCAEETRRADGQGLVTMTIDAVDIAREGSVDVVVVVGELTSAPPLVNRLHAAGLQVLAIGPGHTPDAVRSACDDFIDMASLGPTRSFTGGRHRA